MNQVDHGNLVMILERSSSELAVSKTEDGYVLEGIAAVFGEENNNQRIYEEKEYLPHLDYLNKKIHERRLMGELDHPEKFDVMLKNASHVVEALDYDSSNRQLKIRVRLLDTPNGRIAKNLVDANVPVSISSRAAGVVENDKRVKIKRIFTYDLVADPGFESAQLSRVNESLGYGDMDNVGIYDISKDKDLYENYVKAMGREGVKIDENSTDSEMEQPKYVKVEELHNYSLVIRKELQEMKESFKTLQEGNSPSNAEELAIKEARIEKLENYVGYLADNLDRSIQYQEYLADSLDKNIEYGKYVAENLDSHISYTEYLAENVDRGIVYSEYIAEMVDKGISYQEYLAENIDQTVSYTEYLAEKLDKGIGYTEYLAENLDLSITSVDELNEKVTVLNEGQEYYDAEGKKKSDKKEDEDEYIENEDEKDNEEKLEESISSRYDKLSSKVDNLLESVKKQKTDEIITESEHSFFRLLGDEKRKEFLSLNETEKTKVTEAIEKVAYSSETDIVQVWESALTIKTEIPRFISDMPEDIKKIWENLDERHQQAIVAQSVSYNLDTPYQIQHFWNTRNIKDMPVLEKLNENETPDGVENEGVKANLRGYDNNYVNSVMEGLDKYQSRKK